MYCWYIWVGKEGKRQKGKVYGSNSLACFVHRSSKEEGLSFVKY